MGKETFDKSSVIDNISGVEPVGIYDSDANRSAEGAVSTKEEAIERAETDLKAQEVADKAQQCIQQNQKK